MGDLSLYPQKIDKFIDKKNETGDGQGDYVLAEDINAIQDAIVAIQNTLGTNPHGSFINVNARLQSLEKNKSLNPSRVTIYSGDPLLVNDAANSDEAARYFTYFDQVILRNIDANSNEILNTRTVIEKTHALSNTKFYIEIDAGVFTSNYTIDYINVLIDTWANAGIDGVYFINFGYDKGVNRRRQNDLLDLVHNKGLYVIVSATNIDDIFSTDNLQGMNEDNEPINIDSDDAVLYRNFAIDGATYQDINTLKSDISKLIYYRTAYGNKIFALATIDEMDETEAQKQYYYAQALSILYSLDSFHAINSGENLHTVKFYNNIPIVGNFYETNPIIEENGSILYRNTLSGTISIDTVQHTYEFENSKVPLSFIDLDADNTLINANKLYGNLSPNVNIDVINRINNSSETEKISADKILLSGAGSTIIDEINTVANNPTPKINSNAISGLNIGHIEDVVVEALNNNLQTLLNSGTYDANLKNLTASFISALSAYFNNVMIGDATVEGINAGMIRAGYISPEIIEAGTITSDKLSIHANSGVNKWVGTIVLKENTDPVPNPDPTMVLGKDVYRKLETSDNNIIDTGDFIGTSLNHYLAMWETHVFCVESFSRSLIFNADSPASIYVNGNLVINTNNEPKAYTLNLEKGWNHIQVVQDHSTQLSCSFDLGIKLSDYALNAEKGQYSEIARVDAYADRVTEITGDYIKTGTIEGKHLNMESVKTGLLESGLIKAIEAYIDKIVATDGDFENLLSDLLKATMINTSNIRITSEAQEYIEGTNLLSGNTGVLIIDNGGMLVSSKPRTIIQVVDEVLTEISSYIYEASNPDWVVDPTDLPTIYLKNKTDGTIPTIAGDWYTINYRQGRVTLDIDIISSQGINLVDYDVIATYKYYNPVWPSDAQLIKLDRLGLWISSDGGQTWSSKLTGGGLRITDTAEIANAIITDAHIVDISADKLTAGQIDLKNSISIKAKDGYVNLTYDGLIVQDDLQNPVKMVKIDEQGIKVSNDGGQTWTAKLTGDGLSITTADITEVNANIITSGTLKADTLITIGSPAKIEIGQYDSTQGNEKSGIRILTGNANIILDETGLYTTNNKFKIKADGTIEAVDGSFSGTVKATSGSFGNESNNHILIDSEGLVLNSGSIVDTRNTNKQTLKIDSNGIIAKQGIIGGLDIAAEFDELGNLIDSKIKGVYNTIEQFALTPQAITVSGSEAVTINSGTLVVKDGNPAITYLTLGKLADNVYGLRVDLTSGAYVQLDQIGLRANDGTRDTLNVANDGSITIIGNITAESGSLNNLTIDGTLTINAGGSIVAGDVTLDDSGLTGTGYSLTSSGLQATSGEIAGWAIGNTTISKGSITLDSANEKISTTGVTIGQYNTGVYGIKATQGEIGGWSLDSSRLYTSKIELDSTNEVIKINTNDVILGKYDTTNYGLKAGDVVLNSTGLSSAHFSIDASGISATAGDIAGWTISVNELYSGNIHLDKGNSAIWIGSDIASANIIFNNDGTGKIGIVELNKTIDTTTYSIYTPNFKIDSTGNVEVTGTITANSGTFKGTVQATQGWFGQDENNCVTISGSGLDAGGVKIDKTGISVTTTGGTISIKPSGISIVEGAGGTSEINLNGKFRATNSGLEAVAGKIANWNITDSQLYAKEGTQNTITLDSTNHQILITDQLILGRYEHIDNGDGTFTDYYGLKAGDVILDSSGLSSTKFSLDATGITATGGTIAGWDISDTEISKTDTTNNLKTSLSDGSIKIQDITDQQNPVDKIALNKDGSAVLGNLSIAADGTITAPGLTITSTSASFTGNITANGGSLGSLSITGVLTVGSTISIDGANSKITVNTNDVILDCNGITAKLGSIGGWIISNNQLSSDSNTIILDSSAQKITVGTAITLDANGLTAKEDDLNYLKIDNTGLRIINNGVDIGAAITKDGIIGQLLTDQSITGSKFDKQAPATPTNITAQGFIEQTATGGEFAGIEVLWDAVLDDDLAGYKVYIKENRVEDPYFIPVAMTSDTSYKIRGLKANMSYLIKVSAYDVTGNESPLSAEVECTIAPDATAPDQVQNVRVTDGLLSFAVKWDQLTGSNNVDLDYYEVQRRESTDNGQTWSAWTTIAKVYTDYVIDKDLDYDTMYEYRIAGVDLSGNGGSNDDSNWSQICSAGKPSRIGKADIKAGTITAEELNIGSVVKSINAQKTTLFHFDGTLQSTQGLTPYVEVVNGEKITHQSGFFKKEARFGGSLSIEEDTVNLIAITTNNNADLKDNTGGWTVDTGTYVEVNGVDGIDDGYLEVPYDWNNYVDNVPVQEGDITISVYAKSVDANSKVRVDIMPLDGDLTVWESYATSEGLTWNSSILEQVIANDTTLEWKRYKATFKIPTGSGTTKVRVYLLQFNGAGKVAVDNLQLEQRAYATSFVNSSKSEGYVDYYAPAMLKRDEGTISFWMKNIIGWDNVVNNDHSDTPYQDNLFIWGKPTGPSDCEDNAIYAKYNRDAKQIAVKYNGVWNTYTLTDVLTEDWVHFAFTWKDGQQVLYINGNPVSQTNAPAMSQDPSDYLFRLGYIPRLDGSGNIIEEYEDEATYGERKARASCLFDELRIDKEAVNAEEIQSWFLQESSFYDASAQIDADSQNITAANASVIINNEGITITDGKLNVISHDGQTLITGGRLKVNGLDVGIAQSDNNIYNGNFTIGDTLYGSGDVRQTDRGIQRWSAKYWRSRRSSGPKKVDAINSVFWSTISITNYIDPQVIWNGYEQAVRDEVIAQASKTPRQVTEENIETQILAVNPSATQAEIDACKQVGGDAIDSYMDDPTFDTTTYITNELTAQGLDSYIPIVNGVVDQVKSNAETYPEYNVVIAINQNAPGTPQGAIDICQTAIRNAFNAYISDYNTDTDTMIQDELSTSLPSGGYTDPTMIATLTAITQQTLNSMKTLTKQSIESTIYDTTKEKYDKLLNFEIGIISWNDTDGNRVIKPYHIATQEEEQELGLTYGAMYEVTSEIITKIIKGQDISDIDFMAQIDPNTGLPYMSSTPYEGGGTSYFVDIAGHYLGRVGYAELGVHGPNAETNSIEQDVSQLVVYTDGYKPEGTHFKQHTFSFHGVWVTDASGNVIKSDSAKLEFEVQELVPPNYTLNPDGTVKVLPSYKVEALPDYEPLRIALKAQYGDALGDTLYNTMTNEERFIVYNANSSLGYSIELGHMTVYDDGNRYEVDAIQNAEIILTALNTEINQPEVQYVDYEHVLLGKTGKIDVADRVCYFNLDENGNPIKTAADGTSYKPILEHYTSTAAHPVQGQETVTVRIKKRGDFLNILFNAQAEVDATLTTLQEVSGSNFDVYIDGQYYMTGSLSFPMERFEQTTLTGFYSGPHAVTMVHKGIGYTPNLTEYTLTIDQIEIYDWYNVRDIINQRTDLTSEEKQSLINKLDSENKVEFVGSDTGLWERVSISPNFCNSKLDSGEPLFPERLPIKYRVKCTLSKDTSDSNETIVRITGVQAELGTNPSYTRVTYGIGSIPGHMIQQYNKECPGHSGIQTRHLEEHIPHFLNETGIYERHIADRNITSRKIGYGEINSDHISDGNITYSKTRCRRSNLTNHTLTIQDYNNEYGVDHSKYISFIPETPSSNRFYYLPVAIDYNSEMLFENGLLLESGTGNDYIIRKKIGLIRANDLWEVANIVGEVSSDPTLQAIAAETESRDLTSDEIDALYNELQTLDLYTSTITAKLVGLSIRYATEIELAADPDAEDKYSIVYWQEL